MNDLASITDACGVLVGTGSDGQFAHLATAWSLGGGDWVAAWAHELPPTDACLLRAGDGQVGAVAEWECEDGVAGFTSVAASASLTVAKGAALHKRDRLRAVGFANMVDHPAFRLHHGSLDPARYLPYVCPWIIEGHLALFTSADGYITGRFYNGMAGGPVFNPAGEVVGVMLDGFESDGHPPLTRFRRLD